MNRAQRENESRLLEKVARYRQEYRSSRAEALMEERERRHANGEVYIAGCWVARSDVSKVASRLQRRESVVLFETLILLVFVTAVATGLWRLFAFLMLPY
jgi:hypothetical protein